MAFQIPSVVIRPLAAMQGNFIAEGLTKEVLGTNVPKSLMTRSWDERIDVASDQFGGTIAFFGSGLLLNKGLDQFYNLFKKDLAHKVTGEAAKAWRIVGKSAAIFAIQTALYWAIPFLRDYITASRTGSTNFTQVIGAEQKKKGRKHKQHDLETKQKLHYYGTMFGKTIAIGVGTALAALGLTTLAIKRKAPLNHSSGIKKWLMKNMVLGEGQIQNYPRWAQFFFVALASYAGRFHAIRDQYELKEQLLHFGSFLFGWFIPPIVFENIYAHKLKTLVKDPALIAKLTGSEKALTTLAEKQKTLWGKVKAFIATEGTGLKAAQIKAHIPESNPLFKKLEQLFAKQQIFGLLFSIGVLSILPPFINWGLTKDRLKHDQKLATKTETLKKPDTPTGAANITHLASHPTTTETLSLSIPSVNPPSMASFALPNQTMVQAPSSLTSSTELISPSFQWQSNPTIPFTRLLAISHPALSNQNAPLKHNLYPQASLYDIAIRQEGDLPVMH